MTDPLVEERRAATRLETARRNEERVMRAAHPIAYPALNAIRRPVTRVPGLGVVVTDAALLRGVLMNTASFTKNGPGAPSDLWTPVLGPSVLLWVAAAFITRRRGGLQPVRVGGAVVSLQKIDLV